MLTYSEMQSRLFAAENKLAEVTAQRNTLLMAMARLMNSDPQIATATEEELEEAANDGNEDPVVREQAGAILQARIVMADIEGGAP